MRNWFIFWIGVVSAADQVSVVAPSYTIEQTSSTDGQEHSPAYLRNYLAQQYRHAALRKSITLAMKKCSLGQLLHRLAAHAGLSLVCQVPTKEYLPEVRIQNEPVGQVLHTVLTGHKPVWGILIVDRVLHIAPRSLLLRRARQLLGGTMLPSQHAVIQLADTVWNETFKLRLESLWQQCTREHIGAARRQYFFLDEANQQVLVQGAPEQVEQFRAMVAAYNRVVPPVRIRARVLSCQHDLLESLGLEITRGNACLHAIPASMKDAALTLPLILESAAAQPHLELLLKAAERRHTVRTLLAPCLQAHHGKTAQLLEGQRVPIESVTEETRDGKTKQVRSASYKEVGMQLKVTPRVLADHERVQLEVLVENSQLAHSSASGSYPTITTSQIKNTVVLRSGQAVILGGLVRRVTKRERWGVPFLSRLPLIGLLFSGYAKVSEEQRLYVVLQAAFS